MFVCACVHALFVFVLRLSSPTLLFFFLRKEKKGSPLFVFVFVFLFVIVIVFVCVVVMLSGESILSPTPVINVIRVQGWRS